MEQIIIGIGDGAEASNDVYKIYGRPATEHVQPRRPKTRSIKHRSDEGEWCEAVKLARYCQDCKRVQVYGRQKYCVRCAKYRKRVSTRNSVRKLRKRQKTVAA